MAKIGHYLLHEIIHNTEQYVIYKATLPDSADYFLIKTPSQNNLTDTASAQLQHEYYLLEQLNALSNHFPKVLDFIHEGEQLGLILKDEGYRPVVQSIAKPKHALSPEVLFPLAIELAEITASIHDADIIHKHLIPDNIFYHPDTHALQVYDFIIATQLNRTMVPTDPPRLLQGSLEYMAPEQTGRMNRPLTHRADLYSLGIIFYEWLTGNVPFHSKEPMTIIFGHIATIPKTPHEVNNKIPELLSNIIMKLLSKPAEDRYKSAQGLAYDLQKAYDLWKETKTIELFPLAEQDIATRLELPDKLYGREEQIATLYKMFDQLCSQQNNQLLTVSGYSGIGKTSLIRELISKIALAKGFFATGKFDKFQQSDTYEGLRSALDKVIRYHLSLPEEEYQEFKQTVIQEMGPILAVVTEFIPRLVSIVGEQPPLPIVSIDAARNRFELAINRFIKITSLHHPLVLFLDDVQWANRSMFELLQKIVLNSDTKNLFVIVCYRSNEVDELHPLHLFLNTINKSISVTKIEINGLNEVSLSQLLQDMLYLPAEEVASLTHLMHKKTEGNPFFLLMILEELYKENELAFDNKKTRWLWDENKILQLAASDNVLDFVAKRLEKLSTIVQNTLHLAACIGHTFTLEELALTQIGSPVVIAETLQTAIQAGLVLPTKLSDEWVKGIAEAKLLQREYRFQHDKIQQSCYDIKPPEESKQIHLRIARDWYRIYRDNVSPFRLMAIADQFNKGLNYVADGTEKKLIQSLNDEAGNIALQSAAYEVAYQYHDIAKSLIISNDWRENYETAFKVLLHYIKSSFLSHHYDRSEQASTEALQHANNAFDKAQLVFIKGDLLRIAGKSGVQYYEEAISLVGTPKLIKAHNKFNLLWSLIKFKFIVHHANSQNQEWSRDSTDEQKLMALCTVRLAEEYYYIGDILRWAYVMTNAVNVTYKERLLDYVLRSFFIYGYIWPRSTFSNALCEKGMAFIYKEKNVSMAADVLFAGTSLVFMWHHPLKEAVFHLNYSNEAGEQVGSLEFAALALVYTLLISTTSSLEILLANIEKVKPRVLSISQKAHSRILPLHLSIECLSVSLQAKEKFNDTYILTLSHDLKYPWTEYTFYYQKMFTFAHTLDLFSLKNDISHLWAMLPKINKSNHVLTMLPYNFYLFLLNIILYPTLSKKEKVRSRFKLYSLYHRIKSWVKLCPDNFLPHHLMMRAEYQRLKGHLSKSLILYEKAITAAKEYDNKEIVSLACQRALTACLDANKVEMAKPYADMTLSAYADWGASAVVNLLKQKYHDLLSSSLVLTEKESVALTTEQQQKQEQRERYALDVRSIILASDVISKEIQLQGLLRNVMQLLIENIGATRSALCLMQKGSLWVEGFYDSKDADIKTLTHTHWQDANLSQEVLLTTWRERKEVIMLDVSQETELNISDYFQQAGTKCLIAAPIIRGDHVVGVIYCENNATTNAFTPERIDILRALAIQMAIAVENSRLYTTFEKFVPKPFLHQLGQEFIFDIEQGDSIEKHMNVLFMDIRNFTGFSEQHSAEQTFKFINEYLEHIMPIIHTRHGFIDKFMGDGVMALFPTTSDDALNACIDMQRHIYQFAQENKVFSHLQVGMALHYGPLMLGVVGEKQHIEGTVIGDTVNVTARLESFNKIYGSACLITDNIKKRLLRPDDYQLRHIGQITLLGRKEPTAVWQVLQTIPDEIIRQTFIKQMSLFNDAYHYYLEQQFDTALRHFNQIIKSNPHDQVAQFYSHYCELYKKSPPPQDWHGEIEMTVK